MSVLGKLALIAVVGGTAGWAGLAAGERGLSLATLSGAAWVQLAPWLGQDAQAMQTSLASKDVSASTERPILYYRNPMGLPDTSPVPKKDSMGMDYLPVYAGAADDSGAVSVSAGKLQRTGVRTALATTGAMVMQVRAPGIVSPDERRISVIALRAVAFVDQVEDVTTGATIRMGEPLAQLYSPEITAAAALFITDLSSGEGRAAGSRQRLENLGVPASQIDAMAAAGRAPVNIALTAPRSGVVLERMAVAGMMSEAGATLFRIADTSVVWVLADVPETALTGLRRGAAAQISFPGLPGEVFAGVVNEIYPQVDLQTRTARVRIDLPNPDGRFLLNMYAEVALSVGDGTAVVQVPETSVIDTGDRQVVIRDLGDGRFTPQAVVIGQRGAGMVEIREGIAAGDSIVTTATFLIDAESNLNAALAALATPEAGQ